jgi:DNA-binding HxlR family transcriptional regulator
VQRPGTLERHIPGISTKVLNERLRKLEAFGLIAKAAYASLPPRTVFSLTPNGSKVVAIIAQIYALDDELQQQKAK